MKKCPHRVLGMLYLAEDTSCIVTVSNQWQCWKVWRQTINAIISARAILANEPSLPVLNIRKELSEKAIVKWLRSLSTAIENINNNRKTGIRCLHNWGAEPSVQHHIGLSQSVGYVGGKERSSRDFKPFPMAYHKSRHQGKSNACLGIRFTKQNSLLLGCRACC